MSDITAQFSGTDGVTMANFNQRIADINKHGNAVNPHGVTAAQVGARPSTWMPTTSDIGAMPYKGTIPDGTDLHTITEPGVYWLNTWASHPNQDELPAGMGQFIVGNMGTNISQVWISNKGIFTNYYEPAANPPSWSGWKQIGASETGALTLLNGCVNDTSYPAAPVAAKSGSIVHVNFSITNSSSFSAGTPFLQTPYPPSVRRTIFGYSSASVSYAALYVNTDGTITISAASSANTPLRFSASYTI